MTEPDAPWRGATGAPHPGSARVVAGAAPGHIDLGAVEQPGRDGATLGPEAARWAQSLLEVARFELARADDKANTLFRFYGVVAALSIGLLAGRGWSPADMDVGAQLLFWSGCAAFLASGLYLGMTLYPRDIRGMPARRLLYFGHVIAYESVPELAAALRSVDEDAEHRLVEQLLSVSRLVHAKYGLTRKALIALGAGTAFCLAGVIVDAVVAHA
jgi:pycsar effector protein